MQTNLQSNEAKFSQGDIVFALKSNKQVWPAKILKILSENMYQIKFYMPRNHIKLKRDQIWQFNSQTCQKFVTQKSTVFFRKVVQMAKKHVQRQIRQNHQDCEQGQLNTSFIFDDDVKFQVECSRIQIPFSQKRGLFVVQEVNPNLEDSQNENSCPQHSQNSSNNKKYINKGRHQVQLITLQQTQNESSSKRYQTRSQQRKKIRKAKKAILMAQKQKEVEQLPQTHFEMEQSMQQVSNFINAETQQAVIQEKINNVKPIQYSQIQDLPKNEEMQENFGIIEKQTQNYEKQIHPQPQIQNSQQQNQLIPNDQNLVFYGPVNISDLSTEASFNSVHTITAQQNNSTMASQNDNRSLSSHSRKERSNQVYFHFEQIPSQPSTQESEISVNINQEEIYRTIIQSLTKLQKVITDQSFGLRPAEQVNLSRSLDHLKQTQLDITVINKMIQFVKLFENNKSKNKEKCYMEYMMIRSHLDIIILLKKTQPKSNIQSQVLEILQSYENRKQTAR